MIEIFGTTNQDTLNITDSEAIVFAGDKNDTINGLTHGQSNNRLYGGASTDIIFVENGDSAFGGAGDDTIYNVSGENNLLFGGAGADNIYAGADDLAFGGAGDDKFTFVDIPAAPATIADFSREEGNRDKIVISLPEISIANIDTAALANGQVKLSTGEVLAIVKDTVLTTADLVVPETPILTEDGANSTFTNAEPLTAGTKAGSFSTIDDGDLYKITLAERSGINIELSGLFPGSNGDLILFYEDNFNSVLAASQLDYNSDETISFDFLAAGTYYLFVQQDTGYSEYTLNLTVEEKALEKDNGTSTFAKAPTLPEGNNQGSFSHVDISDMYKIELTQNGFIDLGLTLEAEIPQADADLILFNAQGQHLAASQNDPGIAENINSPLVAGTYYVFIDASSFNAGLTPIEKLTIGGANYDLTYSFTPLVEDGANSTLEQLANDQPLAVPSSNRGSFFEKDILNINQDSADYYKFSIPAGGTVTITLDYDLLGTGADLFLYSDPSNLENPLALDQTPENGTSIQQVLAAGEYYLLITNVVGVTNYTLDLAIA